MFAMVRISLALTLVSCVALASARTVDPLPLMQTGELDELVVVDIVLNGANPFYYGGSYDVLYDPSLLEPVSFAQDVVPFPDLFPQIEKQDGRLAFFTVVSLFDGVPDGVIGSVTFRRLQPGATAVFAAPTQDPRWVWFSGGPGEEVQPDYRGALVLSPGFVYPRLERVNPVAFAETSLNQTNVETVVFRNSGIGPVQVTGSELLEDSPQYSMSGIEIVADQCSGRSVAAGGECTVMLSFSPTELLRRREARALLRLTSEDLLLPRLDVKIAAPVASPRMEVSAAEFFDARLVAPFQQRTVRAVNNGAWPAQIDRVLLMNGAPDPMVFEIVADECSGRTVDAGEACNVELEFRPFQAGRFSTRVFMLYNDNIYSAERTTFGHTPTGLPSVEYDGAQDITLALGESAEREIVVINKSEIPLTMRPGLPFPIRSGFSVLSNDCTTRVLGFSEFCTIRVLVAPESVGRTEWWASLNTDSFFDSNVRLHLSLTGVEPKR